MCGRASAKATPRASSATPAHSCLPPLLISRRLGHAQGLAVGYSKGLQLGHELGQIRATVTAWLSVLRSQTTADPSSQEAQSEAYGPPCKGCCMLTRAGPLVAGWSVC